PKQHPQFVRHQPLDQVRHARLNERSRQKKRCLKELMDHTDLKTTQNYYRVSQERRREAVDRVVALQFDRNGTRVWRKAQSLLDSEHVRRAIGEVSVPYGVCQEPQTSRPAGRAAPSGSAAWAATTSAPMSPTYPTCRHTWPTCCAAENA
ncbi:hypothetical protein AB0F11_33990, partial [Streptomyces sp. NPDC032472]